MVTTIAITGSRSLTDEKAVVEAFKRATGRMPGFEDWDDLSDCAFVHGGARGVDTIVADELAQFDYLTVEYIPADWSLGKAAGFIRNQYLVDRADILVAIWDGRSKGTAHTIGLAAKKGIPVVVEVLPVSIKQAEPLIAG